VVVIHTLLQVDVRANFENVMEGDGCSTTSCFAIPAVFPVAGSSFLANDLPSDFVFVAGVEEADEEAEDGVEFSLDELPASSI
tara:strand:- start:55 stop:303 length:249 start_codon:yes stop_codon:yes gene_type:complete